MTDIIQYPTGKKEARYSPSDKLFTEFRVSRAPITVPTIFGHGNSFKDWGMLGNDNYGDCVLAGGAHETELLNNLGSGGQTGLEVVKFTDDGVLSDYSAITGFSKEDPNSDQGTDVHEALDYRIKTGLIDAQGKRHKIAAYVALEPGNLEHLREALFIFEAVGIGFAFPASAMVQFNRNQVWSVVPKSPIEGGHYVPLVGVPAIGNLACVTWGKRQVMTDGFYSKYCDEAYAFITQEELNRKSQRNWGGFNWADLQADLKSF